MNTINDRLRSVGADGRLERWPGYCEDPMSLMSSRSRQQIELVGLLMKCAPAAAAASN
ncbi:MAG: hypothetical protein IT565_14490 [Rhodospirillales bacterium]|nr:hypothetical protein [Rhodospirillales bacterium]